MGRRFIWSVCVCGDEKGLHAGEKVLKGYCEW